MVRRIALAFSVAAALALPATTTASASASDPLAAVKQCQQEIGWTVAAVMWGEWQRPDCP
jgi:hypothetical protein